MSDIVELACTVESLVESHMSLARYLARKASKPGVNDDDLESDAMLALYEAARSFNQLPEDTNARAFRPWAALWIRRAIRKRVIDAQFGSVHVPRALKRAAESCRVATESLKARGILRPNSDQIAGEARLDVEVVELVMEIPGVVCRQTLLEWVEDKGGNRAGEPDLVPLFPVTSYTPYSPCPHYEAIEHGSSLCCMVCHQSGRDADPALKRHVASEPRPEPRPNTGSPTLDAALARPEPATRRQRRKASRQDPTDTGQH
jgi:RNA polymerase sigma factor (sigma-70 family)